jgi:hypothetical protein
MRDMTDQAAAECLSSQVALAFFAELHFVDSIEYVWTGVGTIDWNGQTWLGMGALASVSPIIEDSQLTSQGISLSLSGIDSTLLSEALTQIRQGMPVRIWLAFFYSDGTIVPEPIMCFAGRMDQPTIDESGETSTITIAVENRMADLQRRLVRRFTDQDQRMDWPRDNGFAFVAQLMDWNSSWGVQSEK